MELLNGYNSNQCQQQQQFICVSPEEQTILDEIRKLEKTLKNYTNVSK